MANAAPTLTGLATSVTFDENTVNATPQLIDGDVSFSDADGNFDGGTLVVSGLLAEDTVSVRDQGNGAGLIGFAGGNVSFGGTVIGTATGGAGASLSVIFNASATSAAIDALIQNLTYANSSNTPTASRMLSVKVIDADGAHPVSPAVFAARTGGANPFNGIDIGHDNAPTFGDLDGDGDFDMALGVNDGDVRYFSNTGSATSPVFVQQNGDANPFNGLDAGDLSFPAFGDLDGDGDLDLAVGSVFDPIVYWMNTGSANAPAFARQTGSNDPFDAIDITLALPAFADLDGDGDLDLTIGLSDGALTYFENTGSASAPVFTARPDAANPFNGIDLGVSSEPELGDLDGDGDFDVIAGNGDGDLRYLENTGSTTAPAFAERTGASNPLNGKDMGADSAAGLVDLDGDGDLDAVAGASSGILSYFENVASVFKLVVNVTAENDAPVARNDRQSTGEDTVLNASVPVAFDEDGTIASYAVDTSVANGSLTFNADGSYSFNPNGAFDDLGPGDRELITFTYHAVDDGGASSAVKTVTVTVNGVNDAPVAVDDGQAMDEDTVLNASAPAATDVDGTIAQYALDADVAKGALVFNPDGSYSFDPNGAFEHLAGGETEAIRFAYHAIDNDGASSPIQTIIITVTGINNAPVARADHQSTGEDTVLNASVPAAFDEDGTIASYAVDADVAKGALVFNTDGSYSFDPNGAFEALDASESELVTFAYHAVDNGGALSAVKTVTIKVTGVNDAPIGADDSQATDEDTVLDASVPAATDVDGTIAQYALDTSVAKGLLTFNSDGTYSFDPNGGFEVLAPGESEEVTFTYHAVDNGGASSATKTVTITVNGVDDAQTLTGLATDVTFAENTVNAGAQIIDGDVTFTDPDNNFDGGTLVVSGLLREDTVAIRSQGSGAGQIDVAGGTVSFGGTVIGTATGGAGATLTVTFNASATSAAIEALIENLTYANSSDTPTAGRTLSIGVTDAAGANSIAPVVLAAQTGAANPFNGIDAGLSVPTFCDLDGDGDLDMAVGDANGGINYFSNTGSASAPAFAAQTGAANPFNGIDINGSDIGGFAAPAFADVDNDGDLDLAVGSFHGTIAYFRNTGSANAPAFAAQTGAANPFNGIDVGTLSKPALVDIDGDSDLDMIVGEFDGVLSYFQNTGSATAPAFAQRTGAVNPFDGIDIGTNSTPTFGDVDGDGDVDMIVGEAGGVLNTFENKGSLPAPAFVERTGTANPLNGRDVGEESAPGLVDLDGDGDLDLCVGEETGVLHYFENATPSFKLVVNVTAENDAPVARNDRKSIGEDTVLNAAVPTATDVDGTIAHYALDSDVAKGALTFNTDGTWSFDPNGAFDDLRPGDEDHVAFTYHAVDDGGASSAVRTVTITVNGVNDAPIATDDGQATNEGTVLTASVPAATDVDGTIVSYALDADVAKGSLTFQPNGTYSFDLDGAFEDLGAGESEQVTFAYHAVDDGGASSAVKTVTITVNGVNDTPVVTSGAGFTVKENETAVGTITATDPDDTPVFAIAGGADGTLFSIDAVTGALAFKASPDFENPADADGDNAYAVLVRASDGTTADTQAITVTITDEDGVTIKGGKRKDTVDGGETVKGQAMPTAEEDIITGSGENDRLSGLGGNDLLNGGDGKDKLFGADGDDMLIGGANRDLLSGGGGSDSFVFGAKLQSKVEKKGFDFGFDATTPHRDMLEKLFPEFFGSDPDGVGQSAHVDKITDFEAGVDTIVLAHGVFRGLKVGALSADAFVLGKKAKDGDDHVIYNRKNGQFFYDQDGEGGKDAVLFAKAGKGLEIEAGDFLVI